MGYGIHYRLSLLLLEADAPKYKYYGEAIEAAIHDMVKRRGKGDVVLYVLGAGRGPLVSA